MTTGILHKGVRLDIPLVRHRLDYLLVPSFVAGIVYSASFSLPEALGVRVSPDSAWPPLRALHTWAVDQEPQHLDIAPALQASIVYDRFVQLAFLVILTLGICKLARWPTGDDPSDDNGTPHQQEGSR